MKPLANFLQDLKDLRGFKRVLNKVLECDLSDESDACFRPVFFFIVVFVDVDRGSSSSNEITIGAADTARWGRWIRQFGKHFSKENHR